MIIFFKRKINLAVDKTGPKEALPVRGDRGLTEALSVDIKEDGAVLTAVYEVNLTRRTATKWCLIRISCEGEVDISCGLGVFCVGD